MKLYEKNYYSKQSDIAYMSYSQFKQFEQCEAAACAQIAGAEVREPTTAMLVGSYVDAWFDGALNEFQESHPQIFKRDGTLKSDFEIAEKAIERVQRDPMFMKYMGGEKQVIMTGEIAGIPYKIKMDSYHPGKAIVDLKYMRSVSPVWDDAQKCRVPFVEAYGYDLQAAIYREIVRQNTGDILPYFLAVVTKEEEPDIFLLSIPPEVLDDKVAYVSERSPHYAEVKAGSIPPKRCGRCSYCRKTKQITEIIDYRDI